MKRYLQTIDLYVYADNDQEAIQIVRANVRILQAGGDNHAETIDLYEQPFGQMKSRPVDFRGLGKTEK